MKNSYVYLFLLGACLTCLLWGCEREALTFDDRNSVTSDFEGDVVDYDETLLSERDALHVAFAKALAKSLDENERKFRDFVFKGLSGKGNGYITEYPALQLVSDTYDGQNVGDLISKHMDGSAALSSRQESGFDGRKLYERIMLTDPSLTVKFAPHVQAYFEYAKEAGIELSSLGQLQFAIVPEVSQLAPNGTYVVYNQHETLDSIRLTNHFPGSAYQTGLPIQIKTSNDYDVVHLATATIPSRNSVSAYNLLQGEDGAASAATSPSSCELQVYEGSFETQSYLPAGYGLLNTYSFATTAPSVCPGQRDCPDDITQCPELCNDGIDNDGDGAIDFFDSDCKACDEGEGAFYRDCNLDINVLTGAKFQNNSSFFNILNPLQPDMEESVTIRADIFNIVNLEGCESPDCFLNNSSNSATSRSVAVWPAYLPTYPGNGREVWEPIVPAWNSDYEHLDEFYSESPYTGTRAHFLVKVFPLGDFANDRLSIPNGAVRIGGVVGKNIPFEDDGHIKYLEFELGAYIINTNWVDIDLTYLPNGDQDWDARVYGDRLKIQFTETDLLAFSSQDGTSAGSETSSTFNLGLSSTLGKLQSNTILPSFSPSASYSFEDTRTRSSTTQITISSERVYDLGSWTMLYTQENDSDSYPYIAPGGVASWDFGLRDDASFGFPAWSSQSDLEQFDYGSDAGFDRIDMGEISLINLIRVE